VASYHSTIGHYSGDASYFATSAVNHSPLHTYVNTTSTPEGPYTYGSTSAFPASTYNSANYWVDVVFTPATTTTHTIWPSTATPTTPDVGSDSPVELGVRFYADTSGTISGIRFYKSAPNTGTHIGNLWSSTGTLLASATFTSETASGWQQVNFSAPVAITANTAYVASYHSTIGHYAGDASYFTTSAVNHSPLHTYVNTTSTPEGPYTYGSTSAFPASTYNSANYWVDVVFNAGSSSLVAPTITTQPSNQTVVAGQTATFSAVASGTAPLSYQWQENGANISGATSASYTTPATTTAGSGSTFEVVVSNAAGTATSSAATLTVNAVAVPGIQVSTGSISFGNDPVGTKLSQTLGITNTGSATLSITQLTASGSTAFTVSGFSLPISISAGQKTTITANFLPASVGSVSGAVSIASNASTSPTSVTLSGSGIAASYTLSVSPTSLSFGSITTGTSSASQSVGVTNTGNSKVAVSQVEVSGSGYTVTGGSTPVTLSPSQTLTLATQFSPTAAGSATGAISIASNATGSPATVSLSGTGVTPVQHSVGLGWSASTSSVSGYNVYRGTASGGAYTKINSSLLSALSYTDENVQAGDTYYYVTTAVDSSGDESVNSNQVSATIP
jgi:hypothetical protein